MWSPEQALETENDIGGGNGEPRSAAGVTPLTPGAPGSRTTVTDMATPREAARREPLHHSVNPL